MICECVQTNYDNKKAQVINIIDEIFLGWDGFNGNFAYTSNPEESVRSQIAELAEISQKDVERYVYLTTFNNRTLIKI